MTTAISKNPADSTGSKKVSRAQMTTFTLVTALSCLVVGAAVLWANPRRFANQAFLGVTIVMTTWLLAVFQAMRAGQRVAQGLLDDPVPWLRANAAIAVFLPTAIVILREAIRFGPVAIRRTFLAVLPWLGLGIGCASLCYTDSFIIGRTATGAYIRGFAYYVNYTLAVLTFFFVAVQTWWLARAEVGIRRIEMQFLNYTFGSMVFLLTTATMAGNYYQIRALNRSAVGIVFLAIAFLAWAMTHHRILDARQVVRNFTHRLGVALALGVGIVGVRQLVDSVLPSPADLFVSIAVCVVCALWLDRRTREWLHLDGEGELQELRKAFITATRGEPQPEQLTAKFEELLREQCQTSFAAILSDHGATHVSGKVALDKDWPGYATLCDAGWATPENLQRRRPTRGVDDLREFFGHHALGPAVTAPRGSHSPSLVLILGTKSTHWPFAYPEVQRLQNIAELIDNILTHAHLASKAALEARMQHLALMSRGLAHDLKNLITPISSYLVHTDGRHAAGSAEAEVHGAAQRSVRLMTDYVREALFFSSRLTPQFEEIDLARTFAAVRELSTARAAQRGVTVALEPGPPRRLIADAVLLQRMLGNLVNNAIDASAPGKTVTLRCIGAAPGGVRFEIVDDGCGIPAENLARVFEPYFTTKQFGDDVRGFGLGLTICEKIVNLHQGTILVRSEAGRGTTVAVELPAAPSAFAPAAGSPAPA